MAPSIDHHAQSLVSVVWVWRCGWGREEGKKEGGKERCLKRRARQPPGASQPPASFLIPALPTSSTVCTCHGGAK